MKKHEPSSFELSKTSGSMLSLVLETGIFIFLIFGGAWLINEAIPYGRWAYIERMHEHILILCIAAVLGGLFLLADGLLSVFILRKHESLLRRLSRAAFEIIDSALKHW
jgi:hypothetical protein